MMEAYSYQERMRRVLRLIELRLDDPPGLDELAKTACFSRYHFHRLFTAATGESVSAYIRRLRLQRAAWRLSYSDMPVTELALEAGYDRLEVFSRAFRAFSGMTHSIYRRSGGAPACSLRSGRGGCLFYHSNPEVPPVEIKITPWPPVIAASMRHVGSYHACGPLYGELCAAVASHGLMHEKTLAIGISYDDPDITPEDKCRMDVCLSLPEGLTESSPELAGLLEDKRITLQKIGGAKEYASIQVKGPYSLLHPAYRSFFGEWPPGSGREPDDMPGFEVYHHRPETTAPEDPLTEIPIPLK